MPGALPPPQRPLALTAGTPVEPRRTWHLPGPSTLPAWENAADEPAEQATPAPSTPVPASQFGAHDTSPQDEGPDQDVPYLETDGPAAAFPLDAFIVPGGSARPPAGYSERISAVVADRLDAIARQIRTHGLEVLGTGRDADELARLVAALVAGYVSRTE